MTKVESGDTLPTLPRALHLAIESSGDDVIAYRRIEQRPGGKLDPAIEPVGGPAMKWRQLSGTLRRLTSGTVDTDARQSICSCRKTVIAALQSSIPVSL